MGRRSSQSILRAETDNGRGFGVAVSETDRERLRMLARWYTLSSDHIARAELPEAEWDIPVWGDAGGPQRSELEKRSYAVSRRLARLARVVESGVHSGPLVEGFRFDTRRATWYATPYGVTEIEAPWNVRRGINPQFVRHAWFAADVGLQIERLGYTVYSEREVSTGVAVDGTKIEQNFESEFSASAGGAVVRKKPDVVVAADEGSTFIAVEVENDKNRSLSTYADKLKAYDSNPDVVAVWYVCSSVATADRVGRAATSVFGQGSTFPLRIRIVEQSDGWMGIENLEQSGKHMNDLGGLR